MRPRLEVVPRAARTAQGAGGNKGLSRTGGYSTMPGTNLSSAACFCGPLRSAGPRYTCMTCLGFARIGRRIEERAPHRYAERRAA